MDLPGRFLLARAALSHPDNRHRPTPWFAERMALYFGALFLIYGVHISYFPVWLHWRGLSAENIGLITALPIFARTVLTPAIGAEADARHNHRTTIIALTAACLVLSLALSQSQSFWPILFAAVPFSIAVSSITPLTETIAVSGVRSAGHDYGRMRLFGSLTFLVATVATGMLIDGFGPGVTIFVMIAASLATLAAAVMLPRPQKVPPPEQPIAAGSTEPRPRAERGLVAILLKAPLFALFLFAVGAVLGSHAAFYTFGALHLKTRGVSGTGFGALWTISIFAEMALLAFSAPLVARFGAVKLIMAGAAGAVIRWGAMSLDPSYGMLVVLQALHALTYGATHVGAIHFIGRSAPHRGAGTAQALYSAIGSGLLTGAATLLAGELYPHLAGQTFLVMAALAGCGLAAAIYIDKTWDGRPIVTPQG